MRLLNACVIALIFVVPAVASAQVVRNPSAVSFTSPDHDNPELTGYEVDFVKADGTVVQTIVVPKAQTQKMADGEIWVTVNVQPVSFGAYTFTARAVAGAIKTPTSEPSDTWERQPGTPSKPKPR